ncbi:MAG: DNA polymerase III subunit delta' [Bacillota bacterium]
MLDGIIGQELAKRYFQRAVDGGRLAHAYLFHGPAGVGKKSLARALAQALVCNAGGKAFCSVCPTCRMFVAGSHPDFRVLDGARKSIGIAEVRELQQTLVYRPYGTRHLCLVQEAEGLTAEAANAFLKTLEEPPAPALFILTSSRPARLPPTVASRCLRIPFRPLTTDEITSGLETMGFKGDVALLAARLAGGSLGRAAELAAGGDGPDWQEKAAHLAHAFLSGIGTAELFARARELGERAEMLARTEHLLLWYRDLLLWREAGAEELLTNVNRLEQIRVQARLADGPALVRRIGVIEDTRKKLLANANVRLAAEVLCLRLAGPAEEEQDGYDRATGWSSV